ncbi:MAG: diacylglycerol kinase family protein [Chitinophagaceae bacterium]
MSKNVLLLYNPGAGHGKHDEEDLKQAIEAAGHKCEIRSVKEKGWEDIPKKTDWLAVAGGDGTVRKAMRVIQEREAHERDWPLGIIPLGTANNVARSVGCDAPLAKLIESWGGKSTRFNTGVVKHAEIESLMFEAAGFGLFAEHILDMKRNPPEPEDKPLEEKLKDGCIALLKVVKKYEPRHYRIESEGFRREGEYLLVLAMNTPMIGPNLLFAPQADPGDSLLDLVMIGGNERHKLEEYLERKIAGEEPALDTETIRVKKVVIYSSDKRFHVEDKLFETDGVSGVEIRVNTDPVNVFSPQHNAAQPGLD